MLVSAAVLQNLVCKDIPYPSRGAEIIRIVIITTTFTLPIAILRLVSRYALGRLWWDDWVVVVTIVSIFIKQVKPDIDLNVQILLIPMIVIPILSTTQKSKPTKFPARKTNNHRC